MLENVDLISVIIAALALFLSVAIWIRQLYVSHKAKREFQASKISAWISHYGYSPEIASNAIVRNESGAPIYEVALTVVGMYGAGPSKHGEDQPGDYLHRSLYVIAPPGESCALVDLSGVGGMHVTCSLEIAFVDGAGLSWVRRGNGKLEQIEKRPFEFYGIQLPAEPRYSPNPLRTHESPKREV